MLFYGLVLCYVVVSILKDVYSVHDIMEAFL